MVEPINKVDSFLYRNSSRIRRYHRLVDNETDVLSVNAERFLRDQAGSSVPWFAYVCPHAPHSSYYPAPRHADEFTSTPLRNVPNGGSKISRTSQGGCKRRHPTPTLNANGTLERTGESYGNSRRSMTW